MSLEPRYNPQDKEDKWYEYWMKEGYFRSTPDDRPAYSIVIPPPNVTGVLHMGHMLNNTIQDILIRKARLDGKNACWVPGTDHASIATEAKVVRMLREKGIKKGDLSREEFLKHAWEWTDKYGGIILKQLRKLGASCDWDRTAFTLDEVRSKQVIEVFVDLYNKGKLYRGLRMVNWDPEAKTVLSNEEVIHHEENAFLYHVRYQVEGTDEYVTIATQRPETIMGDSAVAVHPEDERYAHLKGKNVIVPVVNRVVPIIFDEYVDKEFGTGALKVTPAHDPNDYELGLKHNLEVIDTINFDGTLNELAQIHVGLDRFAARKLMQATLEESGSFVKLEAYVTSIGRSERTNAVVEPKLSKQWYVDMKQITPPALEAVMTDEIEFFPKKYKNTYRHWMDNIRDWCISRQLWWGHRIPCWYYGEELFVAVNETEALKLAQDKLGKHIKLSDLKQEEDVLDTWFSSWLWPFSVFDGMEEGGEVDYYYPTSTLVTGWDIIFLWVARMVMAGYEWKGTFPFKHVYFTGMVKDKQRRKMSKSLGNSPDALKLIEKFGADGVRFGMMSCSPAGGDLLFDDKLCEQGSQFCNKMWNALRLVKGWEVAEKPVQKELAIINQLANNWLESKFSETITNLEGNFNEYRLSEAVMELYNFMWGDFFSWYLEIVKPPYGSPIDKQTLNQVIGFYERLMSALHPLMPFVTEEIWHQLRDRKEGEDCMMSKYPVAGKVDKDLLKSFEGLKDIISKVREIRQKNNLKKSESLQLFVQESKSATAFFKLKGAKELLEKIAVLDSLTFVKEEPANTVSFISGTEKYYVQLNLEIDEAAEKEKFEKELAYNKGFLESVNKKLSNERFVNNAPAAVVEKEKQKQADALAKIQILEESLAKLNTSSEVAEKKKDELPAKKVEKTNPNKREKSQNSNDTKMSSDKITSLKRKAIIFAKTAEDRKKRLKGKANITLAKKRNKLTTRVSEAKDPKSTAKYQKPGYQTPSYKGAKGKAVSKLHFEQDLLGANSSETSKAKASSTKAKASSNVNAYPTEVLRDGTTITRTVSKITVNNKVVWSDTSLPKATTGKKATAKKSGTKKAVAKKTTTRKPAAKKAVAKKTTTRKPAAKKAVAKKTTTRKPAAKKTTTRKRK